MPPASTGQVFWQSESALHDGAHTGGAGGGGGGFAVVAGGGSVGAMASSGTSALLAQAVAMRIAVTANTDFEKVAYFTERTLRQG